MTRVELEKEQLSAAWPSHQRTIAQKSASRRPAEVECQTRGLSLPSATTVG
jgi:hypothetical protein